MTPEFSSLMEKVTILFFADSHLGFDYPIRPRVVKQWRGYDFFDNYHHILRTAREKKVDLVIHGGDVFYRSLVHTKIVDMAYDALFELADSGIPAVIVPGNHDRSKLPTSLFLQHPNLYIFHSPDVFHLHLKGRPFNICGFPFIKYIGDEISAITTQFAESLPDDEISLLCMHQAVQGSTVGPSDYTFRAGREVIRMSDLNGPFQAFLSGHIHRYQILRTNQGVPFVYPGSIERTSFAELMEEKGYVMLEFDGQPMPKLTFHDLPSRPMHIIKIQNPSMEKSALIPFLQSELAAITSDAVIRLDSPTKEISKWLTV